MNWKPEDWEKVPLRDMPAFLEKYFPDRADLKQLITDTQRTVNAANVERFAGYMAEVAKELDEPSNY